MPFHIEKKNPIVGTLYYAGNNQWHQRKDNRMIYENKKDASVDARNISGKVVEE